MTPPTASHGEPVVIALAPSNNRVKQLRRLHDRRAARHEANALVVEGTRVVRDVLDAGCVDTVFVRAGDIDDTVVRAAAVCAVPVYELDTKTFDGLTSTVTPQGSFAVARWHPTAIDAVDAQRGPIVVLDGVADPGNAGTMIRVAAAAGAAAVIAGPGTVDVTAPKVVRAAAGALWRVPIVTECSAVDALHHLRARSICCVGAAPCGGIVYDSYLWTDQVALVMGSEAHGFTTGVGDALDATVSIDMVAGSESLNVAVACAVLLFDIRRRRSDRGPA